MSPSLLQSWLESDIGAAELKRHVDDASIANQLPLIERERWLEKVRDARRRLKLRQGREG